MPPTPKKAPRRSGAPAPCLPLPDGADAAIFFVDGQYAFRSRDEGRDRLKFIAPSAVRQAFSHEPVDSGWLPAGAVRWGTGSRGDWLAAYRPAARYRLLFAGDGQAGEQRLTVPLPGLVFLGVGAHYYLWAIREDEFMPSAELFHAPLPNAGHTGLICFGANPHPKVAGGGFEAAWKTFVESPFSDHHRGGKSRSFPDDVMGQLLRLAGRGAKTYPRADLVALGCTAEEAVARVTERGHRD
jgi:PRTRC genetic system protein B